MKKLIIVRHGQSEWNAKNKFTGWVDSPLSAKGKLEAKKAGKLIKELNIPITYTFTSFLIRAKNTLEIILNVLKKKNIHLTESWELNERHYGYLTGLNKKETELEIGEKLFKKYRRSWNIAPPRIRNDSIHLNSFSKLNYKIPLNKIPTTESLQNTYNRVIPYFEKKIYPLIKKNECILLVAHGNSLRALCKNLFKINNNNINNLEIPTGNPLLISFNKKFIIEEARYLDSERRKPILSI
tara:strand:+ start:379 stop:1098 length:720 start_codon:yes stop_codon:yes gene_type:complete